VRYKTRTFYILALCAMPLGQIRQTMIKIQQIWILLILTIASCNTKSDNRTQESNELPDKSVALKFINEYTDFCKTNDSELNSLKWIQSNELTTNEFKLEHKRLIEKARLEDEEIGLGFDPIFNAQDYPEAGFVFSNYDNEGYLILKGKGSPEFKVVVRTKLNGDKWLVDGAGVVNIPQDKQLSR
jgi:hypothetical protein